MHTIHMKGVVCKTIHPPQSEMSSAELGEAPAIHGLTQSVWG